MLESILCFMCFVAIGVFIIALLGDNDDDE